ncbi:hypothetical protein [Marinagarivorans algicola]|uniref:hypothetical protein n=1 Tax=Marinagarivorans algicola TaxID=1513270 RepID=UPI0037361E0F
MPYVKAVIKFLQCMHSQLMTEYWRIAWLHMMCVIAAFIMSCSACAEPIVTQQKDNTASSPVVTHLEEAQNRHVTKAPLNEDKLWLPRRYQKYHLPLLRAAKVALAQPRCYEIKRGSLDLRQSEPKHAIYRFLCKQASGKTYSEVIDGVTFQSLVPRPSSEIVCYELLMAQVKMMKQVRWLNDTALTAGDGEPERYEWQFDSVAVDGQPLKYSALCQLNSEAIAELKIMPRRE